MAEPVFSIIVCTYNGARHIEHTLDSLQELDYPSESYEIIVVDDGSSDDTAKILGYRDGLRVITHAQNQGLAAARNTGLQAAAGTWVACLDDDCTVDPRWLTELEKALEKPNTIAAGSMILPEHMQSLSQRYLFRSGYGRPARKSLGAAKSIFGRLKAYVADKFATVSNLPIAEEVHEVYGTTSAFERAKLVEVGGFDSSLATIEDVVICDRLRKKYPDGVMRYAPAAQIKHDYVPSFGTYLKKIYKRQKDNLDCYLHILHKMPPIFPFPLAVVGLAALSALFTWWAPFIALAVLPLCFYAWWTLDAVRNRRPESLLFAYMQFLEESTRVVGLAVAALRLHSGYWAFLLVVAGLLLGRLSGLSMLQLPLIIAAILLPGFLVVRALGIAHHHRLSAGEHTALAATLGTLWVMLVGFVAVAVLPLTGVTRPLELAPLGTLYTISIAAIGFAAYRRRVFYDLPKATLQRLGWDAWLLVTLCFGMITTSFVGAQLLNNGRANTVAIAAIVLGAVALMTAIIRAKHLPKGILALTLFSVSLSALWLYSMRSGYLFGWDIQQEFAAFQATHATASWHLGVFHEPYDAMLSLNVLPESLSRLSGMPGLHIFKVFFPMLFSLVPVLLFYTYQTFAKKWIAFAAAAVGIAQFAYMQEFSALARQQIAFLFFAALLYAIFRLNQTARVRAALIIAFSAGMIVSHYSTTYLAIALLTGTYLATKVVSLLSYNKAKFAVQTLQFLQAWMVGLLIIGAVIWYGPATHSSGIVGKALQNGNYSAVLQDMARTIVPYDQAPTAPVSTRQYLNSIGAAYRTDRPYLGFYPNATNNHIAPKEVSQVPVRWPVLHFGVMALDTLLRYGWWLAGALGIVALAWRLMLYFDYQRVELAGLGLCALGVFAAMHVLPDVSKYYNIPRVNAQALMIVSLPAILVLAGMLRKFPVTLRKVFVGTLLGLSFIIAAGLVTQFVGGTPSASLNNKGADYDHFYIHQTDVAAATWLNARYSNTHDVVYADRYASLRLTANTGIKHGIVPDITPTTLAQGAYVYADRTNVVQHSTTSGDDGRYTYAFPTDFLRQNKNLLYSNGYAEIYR